MACSGQKHAAYPRASLLIGAPRDLCNNHPVAGRDQCKGYGQLFGTSIELWLRSDTPRCRAINKPLRAIALGELQNLQTLYWTARKKLHHAIKDLRVFQRGLFTSLAKSSVMSRAAGDMPGQAGLHPGLEKK